jgi:hypothetical protein
MAVVTSGAVVRMRRPGVMPVRVPGRRTGRSGFVEDEVSLTAHVRDVLDNTTPRCADVIGGKVTGCRKIHDGAGSCLILEDMDTENGSTRALAQGLAGYVRAVAEELGVPTEGTGFEISDTATAYLGLARRWSERPGRDLMLVWSEQHGWSIAVEVDPTEAPIVVAHLGGDDLVPTPRAVAQFVTDVLAGRRSAGRRPTFPAVNNRDSLAERLNRYVTAFS